MLNKEDYEEPCCPLDLKALEKKKVTSIPIHRMIEKLDEYLEVADYPSAERHLLYWWQEAVAGNDDRGLLVLSNELMGFYRKQGNGEKAVAYAEKALELVDVLTLDGNFSGGNTYLNVATVYKAFGQTDKALKLFDKAKTIYEGTLAPNDDRLCGLYNNMGLAYLDDGQVDVSIELYQKALEIHHKNPMCVDSAIAYLNLADAYFVQNGQTVNDRVKACLDDAKKVLNQTQAQDGYYAYVCEKCAPVFDGYGDVAFATELKKRRDGIYEGH